MLRNRVLIIYCALYTNLVVLDFLTAARGGAYRGFEPQLLCKLVRGVQWHYHDDLTRPLDR